MTLPLPLPLPLTSFAALSLALLFLPTAKAFSPRYHVCIASSPRSRAARRPFPPEANSSANADVVRVDDDTAAAAIANDDDGKDNRRECGVLVLDHLNINHERGRHDALKAFYFDFLGCAIDPRKYENYLAGEKTVWANIGMHQFHLPEGKPDAQVFDGLITLVYDDLEGLMDRHRAYLDGDERFAPLKDSEFLVGVVDDMMLVTDPWGSQFCILQSDDPIEDRAAHVGVQPIEEGYGPSAGLAMEDLTVYVPHGANLEGIGRFYERVLGALVVEDLSSDQSISVAMGERQTLTFQYHPEGPSAEVMHYDFSYDQQDGDVDASLPVYPSNHGPHISLYVTDLSSAYKRAEELGVLYVNPRFKRRAYTEEEAVDQCMFRIIDIYDPLDKERDIIISLEHEVRSAKTSDGKKYKSCPLLEIPV
mmetsp:Transcript_53557/g.113743  ORF Transcript_53557/g.113743 Transcript_53557/m.113743 type:complete len:421 (+) Transcript_53557:75-1337(+)|eukprot:CAMPEP_0172533472 /NCGR_PEP_ID=MMETSP1067-20121228/6164_1 /TAXON_ID=265564 ORGANISM="Thalassiosira punctigera, Strain Tpunct2005C2" /NCGR_SAMPLE_ID=MMETSP1067 /ASSEMBLY_ACC=CAM_ASM_000444 /LENGTH=420 /DNA_ID=CAMNT_0013318119 /DNA_START=71 /DNA_END=1333 /DNA_ORIENTATION=+